MGLCKTNCFKWIKNMLQREKKIPTSSAQPQEPSSIAYLTWENFILILSYDNQSNIVAPFTCSTFPYRIMHEGGGKRQNGLPISMHLVVILLNLHTYRYFKCLFQILNLFLVLCHGKGIPGSTPNVTECSNLGRWKHVLLLTPPWVYRM